jgi:hypothetical protein
MSSLFTTAGNTSDHIAQYGKVNRMYRVRHGRKLGMTETLSSHLLEGTDECTKKHRMAGVCARIRNRHHQNQKYFRLVSTFSVRTILISVTSQRKIICRDGNGEFTFRTSTYTVRLTRILLFPVGICILCRHKEVEFTDSALTVSLYCEQFTCRN